VGGLSVALFAVRFLRGVTSLANANKTLLFRSVLIRSAIARPKCLLLPACLIVFVWAAPGSRAAVQTIPGEQSSFGTEEFPGQPFLKRPVPVPEAVSEILMRDDAVQHCLGDDPLPSGEPLSSWFVASEIHLDDRNETDLVVLPNPKPGGSYLCFHSVEGISWFWVFRGTAGKYELMLKASGNQMQVLQSRHSGHRDIQTVEVGQAGKYLTTVTFRFDGKHYQTYRENTQERR
jgi:hypothetical protein